MNVPTKLALGVAAAVPVYATVATALWFRWCRDVAKAPACPPAAPYQMWLERA